ncbi:UNVERIFIED_CONTAM: hypothetical protein GTU68_058767 [Idotea baltica]|nr:hypothetical protein [Idotea baltica]
MYLELTFLMQIMIT